MPRSSNLAGLLALGAALWAQKTFDPKAWGSNHAGQPVPEFVQGDECLFCHRMDIGTTWKSNRHGITIRKRQDAPELAARHRPEAEYFLGSRAEIRLLRKSGYGKFAILEKDQPVWNADRFAARCAGCHTTGVDAASRTFAAFGLDCYACHGDVSLEHTNDTSLIWLSKKRRSNARAVTSICAQCHLRGGRSRSTALPYPNNFVAGDNLFQDFDVDFAKSDDPKLNPGDRHVWSNLRDVLQRDSDTTCLSCHRIHEQSSARHRRVTSSPICLDCHYPQGPRKAVKPYAVHSELCEY